MAKHVRMPGDRQSPLLNGARPAGGHADGSPYSSDASRFSRDSYGSGGSRRYDRDSYGSSGNRSGSSSAYGKHRATRARHAKRKRTLAVVMAVVLALAVAAGVAVGLYMHALSDAMALGEAGQTAASLLEGTDASKPYYVLVIGSDTRDESQYEVGANESLEGERADSIILARIDERAKQVTLLSIPRDTPWVDESGAITKINESYTNRGPAGIIGAVEQVSGVNIAHYVQVRFAGFEHLVDALGGVTVDVPVAVSRKDALTKELVEIEAGKQTLDGQQALIFARARHEYGDDQESKRQGNQRILIQAILGKIRSTPLFQLPSVILEAATCVGTDLSALDVVRLGLALKDDMTMYGASAPHKGDFDEALGGIWLCYDDREGWRKVIEAVDAGRDPSDVSYAGDVAYIAGTDQTVVIE